MDRGAWRAMVHGVAKSWTQLWRLSMHPPPTEVRRQGPCFPPGVGCNKIVKFFWHHCNFSDRHFKGGLGPWGCCLRNHVHMGSSLQWPKLRASQKERTQGSLARVWSRRESLSVLKSSFLPVSCPVHQNIKSICRPSLGFSNVGRHQNHLDGLFNHCWLIPTPSLSQAAAVNGRGKNLHV